MDAEVSTFAVVFAGILLMAALGIYLVQQKCDRLFATGGRVMGEVVRNNVHLGRVTVTYSVIRFTTIDGVIVEAEYTNGIATVVSGYHVGQKVRVAYDKANVTNFIILG